MKCPSCETDLARREARGAEIDLCPTCLGVFIERPAVGKVVEQKQEAAFISAVAAIVDRAEREVFTDGLSGLRNRKFFDRQLVVEAARALSGRSLSVLLLDLDGFKNANDEHGHLTGDRVLADFAAILRQEARTGDYPARVGGDEFGVIMPETKAAGARALAERLIEAVAAHAFKSHEDDDVKGIGVSAGYAVSPDDTGGAFQRRVDVPALAQKLFELADQALYRAKDAGRACVRGVKE